jgi:hypothetical protein
LAFVLTVDVGYRGRLVGVAMVRAQSESRFETLPLPIPGQMYTFTDQQGRSFNFMFKSINSVTPVPSGFVPCNKATGQPAHGLVTLDCADPTHPPTDCSAGTIQHFCNPSTGLKIDVRSPSNADVNKALKSNSPIPAPVLIGPHSRLHLSIGVLEADATVGEVGDVVGYLYEVTEVTQGPEGELIVQYTVTTPTGAEFIVGGTLSPT